MVIATSVEISDERLAAEAQPLVDQLVAGQIASKLFASDPTLWGPTAEADAAIRLAWTGLHESSRPLLAEIDALRAEIAAEGLDRIVLAGMGGSSLAAEVIAASAGVRLIVLDTTDPQQLAEMLEGDLERTLLVASSKSGTTVETDSHLRIFQRACTESGLNAAERIVVITDPGSPMQQAAEEAGYRRVFTANPHVGGRYSALSAFGLVPAGLAGADVATLLDDAERAADLLSNDSPTNPAVIVAAALGTGHGRGAEKVIFADSGSGLAGFGDWVEQLIAESTGKNHTGLLPVVVETPESVGFVDAGDDATTVAIGPSVPAAQLSVQGSLGAQLLLWEAATALIGRVLGINPFDQPDVEAAKQAARSLLDGPTGGPLTVPATVHGAVEVHVSGNWLSAGVGTATEALRAFLSTAASAGYVAIQAYMDREGDASLAVLRSELARASGLQTTFGWGPRFLHSTGQYHKGGHQNGIFLQITGVHTQDIDVPGRPYTLGALQQAQALGDGQVLGERRPVLRLHLTDREAGLVELVTAVQQLQDQALQGGTP